jgi:hypothetical protein
MLVFHVFVLVLLIVCCTIGFEHFKKFQRIFYYMCLGMFFIFL